MDKKLKKDLIKFGKEALLILAFSGMMLLVIYMTMSAMADYSPLYPQ